MTVDDLLKQSRDILEPASSYALLEAITGRDRAWLLAHRDHGVPRDQQNRWADLLARAADGEPLAYLLGWRWFAGMRFEVTPDVLIPRPETEDVIDAALAAASHACRVIDVGTGSGAIAITLAHRLPRAQVIAVDSSNTALDVARRNAESLEVSDRVLFLQGDLLTAVSGPFDLVIANLPYIPTDDLAELELTHWEPRPALDGGPDGLDLFRRMLADLPRVLASNGVLALEIGYDQGHSVPGLVQAALPGATVSVVKDFTGNDRAVIAQGGG